MILCVTHPELKGVYIETRNKLNRHQLDSRTHHSEEWKQIHSFYHSDNDNLDKILGNYTEFNYTQDEPSVYDFLSVDDVQHAVSYINYQYGEAKRKKNVSGQNKDFADFVSGKGWLLFYHNQLLEIGDTDLMNATYAELPKDVFCASDGPAINVFKTKNADGTPSSLSSTGPSRLEMHTSRYRATDHVGERNRKQGEYISYQHDLQKRKRLDDVDTFILEFETKLAANKKALQKARTEDDKIDLHRKRVYMKKRINRYYKERELLKKDFPDSDDNYESDENNNDEQKE